MFGADLGLRVVMKSVRMLLYQFTVGTSLKTCRKMEAVENKQVNGHSVPRSYTILTTDLHFGFLEPTLSLPRTFTILPSAYTFLPWNYTPGPRTYTIEARRLMSSVCGVSAP